MTHVQCEVLTYWAQHIYQRGYKKSILKSALFKYSNLGAYIVPI